MNLRHKLLPLMLATAMVVSPLAGINFAQEKAQAATNDTSTFDDLDQDEIVDAMAAGWNLGNQLESVNNGTPGETNWGNPTITEDLILAVKDAGFNTIRIPVSYMSMIDDSNGYTINSSWLDRVQEVVDMCVDNGLYAVINIHGDGYTTLTGGWLLCGSSDQTTIKAKYKAVWKQIATRFADYDEHLIFESMNEEFDGTYSTPSSTAYANINAYNQIFVDTVRQTGGNNDKRWLLIPGWNTNITYTAGSYGFEMPSDDYLSSAVASGEKRIMVSVHYYDPWDFCGTESSSVTQWGDSATDSSKVASWGDESYLKSQFKSMYTTFVEEGYPVVIGEYGSIDKSAYDSTNTACRAEFASKVCSYADQYGMVPVLWDNGDTATYGFAVINRSTYAVTQQTIIDAIMDVYGDRSLCNSSSDISLSANNLTSGAYTSSFTSGDFTIGASSSKYVSVESCSVTLNSTKYTKRLKMNGAGNSAGRYIKFTTTGACKVTFGAASTSTSVSRTIRLAKGSVGGTTISDSTVTGTASTTTVSVSSAGTYYLYSTINGIYVYNVSVAY